MKGLSCKLSTANTSSRQSVEDGTFLRTIIMLTKETFLIACKFVWTLDCRKKKHLSSSNFDPGV